MGNTDIRLTAPPENTHEQCDSALGLYMRQWDQVEMKLLPLFNKLIGTHQNASLILLRVGMSQPTIRSMLEAFGAIRLGTDDQSRLDALLGRWERASSRRNRIVHGHWRLEIDMIPGPDGGKRNHTRSEWVRFYEPADSTLHDKMHGKKKDQKVVSAHRFTLSELVRAAEDVSRFATDLGAFVEALKIKPFINYLPIDIDQ
jgi:hypothetical protein